MVTTTTTAAQRVIARIKARLDRHRGTPRGTHPRKDQHGLAQALDISDGSLSELLKSDSTRGLLFHLDKIGEYLEVPPSLFVHRNDTNLMELRLEEYRLVQHWRTFPMDVQMRIMEVFDYFAGLLPEEKEQRRWWVKLRRLNQRERAKVEKDLDDVIRAKMLAPRKAAAGHGLGTASDKGPTTPRARGRDGKKEA